jgi:hypothetical protein
VVHLWLIYDHMVSYICGRATFFWRYHTIPIVLLEGHTHLRFDPRRNRDSDYESRSSNPFSPSSWPEDNQSIFTGESVPTYLPGHWLSRYLGILPTYLPRDWFLPSELVVPLVDAHYRQDYHIWKLRLDVNKRATDYLVNHLRDPSGTVTFSQAIEAPVSIPFVPTVRAAELRWWNGYLITYHSFNNLILLRGHYQNSFNQRPISTASWHTGKSAQGIYATALAILQVGQPTIRLPPNPDFNSLSPEDKDRIYQDLHNQV